MRRKLITAFLLALVSLRQFAPFEVFGQVAQTANQKAPYEYLSAKAKVYADPHAGTMTYSVPVDVPPARQNSQPTVELSYASSQGNGPCGVGWELSTAYIERDTKRFGVPLQYTGATQYQDSKGYIFNLFGNRGRLVKVRNNITSGVDEYRPEIGGFSLKFMLNRNQNSWQVTDQDGRVYVFASRLANPRWTWNDWRGVFRWSVTTVQDANGNRITYSYNATATANNGRQSYPKTITYNQNVNGPKISANHKVEFVWEGRTDPIIDFRAGFRLHTTQRLKTIDVYTGTELVRSYILSYDPSASTGRSLLVSVTEQNAVGVKLPSHEFVYEEVPDLQAAGFKSVENWPGLSSGFSLKVDSTATQAQKQAVTAAFLGIGLNYAVAPHKAIGYLDRLVGVLDVDGDGLLDRLAANAAGTGLVYQKNTGAGFGTPVSYPIRAPIVLPTEAPPAIPQGYDLVRNYRPNPNLRRDGELRIWNQMDLVDMTGDGLADILIRTPGDLTPNQWNVFTNSGSAVIGFSAPRKWSNVATVDPNQTEYYRWPRSSYTFLSYLDVENYEWRYQNLELITDMADMNGDGLPDRVMKRLGNGSQWWVQMNDGASGFGGLMLWPGVDPENVTISIQTKYMVGTGYVLNSINHYSKLVDMNGDGLADRVFSKSGRLGVQLNNGAGFDPWTGWQADGWDFEFWDGEDRVGSDGKLHGSYLGLTSGIFDVNGDGLPDRVRSGALGPWKVWFNTGFRFSNQATLWGPILSYGKQQPSWAHSLPKAQMDLYGNPNATIVDFFDINGDGMPDRVMQREQQQSTTSVLPWAVQLNNCKRPDLLRTVITPMGGKIAATYTNSTSFENRDAQGRGMLPSVVYVLTKLETDDGLGHRETFEYEYSGGCWNPKYSEFRGFGSVSIKHNTGAKLITKFHQSGGKDFTADGEFSDQTSFAKSGTPFRTEYRDADGRLFKLILNKVEEVRIAPAVSTGKSSGSYFAYVAQSIEIEGEPIVITGEAMSSYRARATTYKYDVAADNLGSSGKLLIEGQLGEVRKVDVRNHTFSDVVGDTFYTHYDYRAFANGATKVEEVKITSDVEGAQVLRKKAFGYDGEFGDRGNVTAISASLEKGGQDVRQLQTLEYNTFGNIFKITDALGMWTTIEHDSSGTFPERIVRGREAPYAGSPFTTLLYFDVKSGNLLGSINAREQRLTNIYDGFYRIRESRIAVDKSTEANLWTKKYQYRLGGVDGGVSDNWVRIAVNDNTDVTGHQTATYLNGFGEPVQSKIEGKDNQFYSSLSIRRGLIEFQSEPLRVATLDYIRPHGSYYGSAVRRDVFGRVVEEIERASVAYANGQFGSFVPMTGDQESPTGIRRTAFGMGGDPWVQTRTEADDSVSQFFKDAFGRVVTLTEAGANVQYKYSLVGELENITDAALNNIQFEHDGLGRITRITHPDIGTIRRTYNELGQLRTQKDAKGQVVTYGYKDVIGRLTSVEASKADGSRESLYLFSYDTAYESGYDVFKGQLAAVTTSDGDEIYGYDFLGQLRKHSRRRPAYGAFPANTRSFEYDYDQAGRLQVLRYPGNQVELHYGYSGNYLDSIQARQNGVDSTIYDAGALTDSGQLSEEVLGGAITRTYQYYPISKRLKGVNTVASSGQPTVTYQNLEYGYDVVGRIASIIDNLNGGPASLAASMSYDGLRRLDTLTRNQTVGDYQYAPDGRILENPEDTTGTYVYDRPHGVTSVGQRTLTYDESGNVRTSGDWTYEYNAQNRLASASHGWFGVRSDYLYGFDGERWDAKFTMHGSVQFQFFGELFEARRDGPATETETYHVKLGESRIATFSTRRNPDGALEAASWIYYVPDHLGSPNLALQTSSGGIQKFGFSAFGKRRYEETVGAFHFGVDHLYTGQFWEQTTRLYFYKSRYYDPEIGRFIQPDSIIPDIFDSQSLDPYAYVGNDPVNYTDPTGHNSFFVHSPGARPGPSPGWNSGSINIYPGGGGYSGFRGPMTYTAPVQGGIGSSFGQITAMSWQMPQNSYFRGPNGNGTYYVGHGRSTWLQLPNGAALPVRDPWAQRPEQSYSFSGKGAAPVILNVSVNQPTASAVTVDRIRDVAQGGYNYAVQNPRVQGLNRMQLGKDAEVQATRWVRRWAERNDVNLGPGGLQFQVRGAHSVPDVTFDPARHIFDFKLTPRAVRAAQTQNFGTDFPGYNIEYIFGP